MPDDSYAFPFPSVIRIEPSGACNLSCSHCPTGTVKLSRGVMRPETFHLVLANIQNHLSTIRVVVLYHGGEPLLNRYFIDMVRNIKALGIPFVKTVSNGMLLDDSAIKGIVEASLDEIEVSLDGESPEENDLIRRNCNYSTVIANINRLIAWKERFQKTKPAICISSTRFLPFLKGKPVSGKEPPPQII